MWKSPAAWLRQDLLVVAGCKVAGFKGLAPGERSSLHEIAPRTLKLHYHSGSLFSQACDGWSIEMSVERGVVLVDFIEQHFGIIIARD